jgi:hypothetical protein
MPKMMTGKKEGRRVDLLFPCLQEGSHAIRHVTPSRAQRPLRGFSHTENKYIVDVDDVYKT